MSEEFILPKRVKKRRKGREDSLPLTFLEKLQRDTQAMHTDQPWVQARQAEIKEAIQNKNWSSKPAVLCLGLGSPSESRDARLQLAFLLDIANEHLIDLGDIALYDPVFSEEDRVGLESLGLTILTKNDDGKIALNTPHLVFMPHCYKNLHENLLEFNWSSEKLHHYLLIGNQLDEFVLHIPEDKMKATHPCIHKLATHKDWKCIAIPKPQFDDKAFAGLAIQYLGENSNTSADFWAVDLFPSSNTKDDT